MSRDLVAIELPSTLVSWFVPRDPALMATMRDQLVFKAVCVLDDAIEQARWGRVPPSPGLRFALAFLYAAGDRRGTWFDRQPYDDFWRRATIEDAATDRSGQSAEAYGRVVHLRASMNAIARAAGLELDVPVIERIAKARCG